MYESVFGLPTVLPPSRAPSHGDLCFILTVLTSVKCGHNTGVNEAKNMGQRYRVYDIGGHDAALTLLDEKRVLLKLCTAGLSDGA